MAERMLHRGYRYRLYPTPEQETFLRQSCGAVRAFYNAALEQRRDHWRNYQRATGKRLNAMSQSYEIKDVRAAFDWMAAVPNDVFNHALRDLDQAFAAFFSGRAAYPTWRRAGVNDAFRLKGVNATVHPLNGKWATVRVPKLGPVKYRAHRRIVGAVRGVTISHRGGAWWVAFSTETAAPASAGLPAEVGIDRGVAQTLTLSNGEAIQAPDNSRLEALKRRAQRTLARRKKGSNRYRAQKARLGRLSAQIAAKRSDWCHRASRDIADRFGLVAIEALNVRGMTASAKGTVDRPGRKVRQKAGLNRSILNQSWGRFATFLDYKLSERGGALISVPAAYTSQTCSHCGVIDASSRKNQSVFACVACDHTMNADHNAAINIWRRSTASLDVEAGVARPSKRQPQERYHA